MAKSSKSARPDGKPAKAKPVKAGTKAKAAKAPKPRTLKLEKPRAVKAPKPKTPKPPTAKLKPAKPKSGRAGIVTAQPAARDSAAPLRVMPPLAIGATAAVLDRLWGVVMARRDADPAISHSARLLARGNDKVAQKFGEEAVECLIEAVAGNRDALVAESADVLYHLLVLWVANGVRPDEVWSELHRREGISGVAEKASRSATLPLATGLRTTKIP